MAHKQDFVFPYDIFSAYCGPGGAGLPQHVTDQICKKHDENYTKIIKENGWWAAYGEWNWADKIFLDAVEKHTPESKREWAVHKGSQLYFELKKYVAHEMPKKGKNDDWDDEFKWDPEGETDGKGKKRPIEVETDGAGNIITPEKKQKKDNEISPFEKKMGVGNDSKRKHHDDPMGQDSTSVATVAPSGRSGGSLSNKQITEPTFHSPSFGISETHTAVLPYTCYFSIAEADFATPIVLDVRMNTTNDVILTGMQVPVAGAPISKGIFNRPIESNVNGGSAWPATDVLAFPSTTGTGTVERPTYKAWFDAIYDVVTTLGCEWELTIKNAQGNTECQALVGHGYNVYSGASAGNVFPMTTLHETIQWPDLEWDMIHPQNANYGNQGYKVIRGKWKPYEHKHNVVNEEDIRVWNPPTFTPTYHEELEFMFFAHPTNSTIAPSLIQVNAKPSVALNCQLTLKYLVQYKDLKQAFRYPSSVGSTVVLTAPTDILQVQ